MKPHALLQAERKQLVPLPAGSLRTFSSQKSACSFLLHQLMRSPATSAGGSGSSVSISQPSSPPPPPPPSPGGLLPAGGWLASCSSRDLLLFSLSSSPSSSGSLLRHRYCAPLRELLAQVLVRVAVGSNANTAGPGGGETVQDPSF